MKYFLVFFLVQITFPFILYSQEEISNSNRFIFTIECPVFLCAITGEKLDYDFIVAPKNAKFLLVDKLEDFYVIRFDLFDKAQRSKFNFSDLEMKYYKYFLISKAQFDFKAKAISSKKLLFSFGNVVVPLKVRPKPITFVKDIMIGPTFGLKIQNDSKQISTNILLGIGVSSVSLDSISTMGYVNDQTDIISFSPSFGGVIQFGNAQIGVFTGYDILPYNVSPFWIYRTKPWFSFGIGYAIFSTKDF